MNNLDVNPRAPAATNSFFLPLMLLLFVGSGCAALIYEIVWLQLLQLVIGLTAVSLGVLLGTFMGGMCLGSLLLPRLVSARMHPLRVYAVLEAGDRGDRAAGVLLVPCGGGNLHGARRGRLRRYHAAVRWWRGCACCRRRC